MRDKDLKLLWGYLKQGEEGGKKSRGDASLGDNSWVIIGEGFSTFHTDVYGDSWSSDDCTKIDRVSELEYLAYSIGDLNETQ